MNDKQNAEKSRHSFLFAQRCFKLPCTHTNISLSFLPFYSKAAATDASVRTAAERKKVTMQASAETFGGTKVSNRPDRQTETVLITDDLVDVRKE